MKTAYFLTHPIQYQSPLLRKLAKSGVKLRTYFATDVTAQSHFDPGYDREIKWDVPLLEGYEYEVLPLGLTEIPRWNGFRNFLHGIRHVLDRDKPDAVWVHGWGNAYSLAAIIAGWQCRIPVILRGESQLKSLRGTGIRRKVHQWIFSQLFRRISLFLSIGSDNEAFYKAYGVDPKKIVRVPYATDNEFFQARINAAAGRLDSLRADLNIQSEDLVILFSGRLVKEKDPGTLIKATGQLVEFLTANSDAALQMPGGKTGAVLLLAGDGELRSELEALASEVSPGQVRFLGFQNQTDLPDYYALCDVMVLPSQFEPWGLVVNEVMNAGKPVIVSDHVGSAADLVVSGENGFVFPAGDVNALSQCLQKLAQDSALRLHAGNASLQKISNWSYEQDVAGVQEACRRLEAGQPSASPASGSLPSGGITLGYLGVHEIFQMGAAAAEMGRLDRFYCSLVDVPHSWGSIVRRLSPFASLSPFGAEHLPPERVIEIPLPLIAQRVAERIVGPSRRITPLWANRWFQKKVKKLDRHSHSRILVGSETCSLEWFLQAKMRGAKCVLDCHGIPVPFLDESRKRAFQEFGLPLPAPGDIPEMVAYKKQERDAADVIVCCSEFQRNVWIQLGEDASKMRTVPLWVDIPFWQASKKEPNHACRPLKVLYAGACSVSKGLPYLIQAVASLGTEVSLTLVGPLEPVVARLLKESAIPFTLHSYMPRPQLRELFGEQNVLVMPSLGDSFGFVAMEAMACGLPVIVSDHCGVPVPDPGWRVPAFSSEAIVHRLRHYLGNPADVYTHGVEAASFASKFTPQEYRNRMRVIFEELLSTP